MGLREFEYFITVSEESNLTKAAEKLHVSQPSLTQQIQRTEAELNCKLLLRTNSGVKLTEAGEAYLQLSRQMLRLYEIFLAEVGQLKKLNSGKIRIGANWYLTSILLPKIISDYMKRYPNIEVHCIENRTSVLLEQLHSGQIDIAFVTQHPIKKEPCQKRMAYLPLLKDEFCLVASAESRFWPDGADSVDPVIIANQPFIMFEPQQRIRQITDFVFEQAGISPRIQLITYGFPIAIAQAQAGVGVVILPQKYVQTMSTQYNIRYCRLSPEYSAYWNIGVYYPEYDILPFPLTSFVDCLSNL